MTRDFLRELSSSLGEHVHLITAGRLVFEDADYVVHLSTFSREETTEYLREEYPDVDDKAIGDIYDKVEGHPYYLGLLREATGSESTFELPEEGARDFIEKAYLDSMSEAQEEFIRNTAVLSELDEEICAAVLDDVSRTQARRMLDAVSSKAVVQELGRSEDTGNRVFKVHDLFREFLHEQLNKPDQLHRAAFQYYAMKLYDEVEKSDAPALEGLVFGVLGSVHLQAMYDEGPGIAELRGEVDQLGLGPNERLRFMFGYAPYAPISEDQSSLLALELDDYAEWIRRRTFEEEADELQARFLLVMVDLMRAMFRSNADIVFEESAGDIYEGTIQQINDFDFVELYDEEDEVVAQIIPDMLLVCVHLAAHQNLEEDDNGDEHLLAAYEVMEKYGLDRVAVEGFIENWRELGEEYEAGEQVEEMVEKKVEDFVGQFDQDDVTRNTLIQMQSGLYSEMIQLVNSAFTAMLSESDRLLEFVHECGDSLERADNPFFVAAWYSITAHVSQIFVPNADTIKELEEAAQHYAEVRREYEEELDNIVVEIEEFEVSDIDLPDLINEVAGHGDERQLTE